MKRVVVDTNIWIRILLAGPVTLRVFEAWNEGKLQALFRRFTDHGEFPSNKEKFRQLIGENLCELKIRGVRLLGRSVARDVFVVAHAVKKKKQRLLPAEFEKARRILEINTLEHLEVQGDEN